MLPLDKDRGLVCLRGEVRESASAARETPAFSSETMAQTRLGCADDCAGTQIATRPVVDTLSPTMRSALMSRVRTRNTNPERVVRSVLHSMGFRFRLHRSDLPGTPDIVLPKYSAVILVHGCFWHRHAACYKATTPKTRIRFWAAKFQANKIRDRKVRRGLARLGWSVITIWECQTADRAQLGRVLRKKLA